MPKEVSPAVQSILSKIKECGINTILYGGSDWVIGRVLNINSESSAPLPFLLSMHYLSATPWSSVFMIHKMTIQKQTWKPEFIKGWNLYDEPWYYMWGDVTYGSFNYEGKPVTLEEWNRLSVGFRICQELTPGKLTYCNFAVPQGEGKNVIGDCENYEQFLDVFQELYRPPLWCYDVYPIRQTSITAPILIDHAHFYRALRLFSQQAKKTKSRFWAYTHVTEYEKYKGQEKEWHHRRPRKTIGAMRFEIFSALACGAQGIIYYRFGAGDLKKYRNPEGEKGDKNYYYTVSAAAIYDNGELKFDEELINMFKEVNNEVQSYKEVFLDAITEDLYHAGRGYADKYDDDEIPVVKGISPYFVITICDNQGQPISEEEVQKLKSCGVLMTTLTNKDAKYVVIVSHDPFSRQQIKLTFADTTYSVVNPSVYSASPMKLPTFIDIDLHPRPGSSNALSGYYALEAGGYLIIKVGGGK